MKPTRKKFNSVITISNMIEISGVPNTIEKAFKRDLLYRNPVYYDTLKNGRYMPIDLMPSIFFFHRQNGLYLVPAGYLEQLKIELKKINVKYTIKDERCSLSEQNIMFSGELRNYQNEAIQDILNKDIGILEARTGAGKTVICIAVMAKRNVNTLIVVHNKELLYQWRDRISEFTNITKKDIGLLGDGHKKIRPITIGIINTVHKKPGNFFDKFGMLVCDEVHRAVSDTWMDIINGVNPKFRLGLSATPYRRDGLDKALYVLSGNIIHTVDAKELAKTGAVLTPRINRVNTSFNYDFRNDYTGMIKALVTNQERNDLIVEKIAQDYTQYKQQCIVISDRVGHCHTLRELLKDKGISSVVLSGQTTKKQRSRIISDLRDQKVQIVLSTISLISEGFDLKTLCALFMTTPITFRGRAIQSIGRILRPKGKDITPRLYDFRDIKVRLLLYSGFNRDKIYKKQGW